MEYRNPDIPLVDKVSNLENNQDDIDVVISEYQYTQMEVFEDILAELAVSPNIDGDTKYRILSVLYEQSTSKELVLKLISSFIPNSPVIEFKVIEWIFSLDESPTYIPRLYKYLANSKLDEKVRYAQLMGLSQYKTITYLGATYFYDLPISLRYKILAGQFILEAGDLKASEKIMVRDRVIKELLDVARNKDVDYNTRADAADVVHHYAKVPETADQALKLLQELGGRNRNVYENKQNVHIVDISGLLQLLDKEPILPFEKISEIIREEGDPKVNSSLGRIVLDVAKYGAKEQYTSEQILERLWAHIQGSEHKEELYKRMIEELREMADTCSSGHAYRLLNTMSGFDGASLTISFENQIISNFLGRMNAKLRAHPECEKITTQILKGVESISFQAEIGLTTELDVETRGREFLIFMGQEMPKVVEELRKEFVPEHMTEDRFNDAITQAIETYQNGPS